MQDHDWSARRSEFAEMREVMRPTPQSHGILVSVFPNANFNELRG